MSIKETQREIEKQVVSGYKKIEEGVVSGYQKIEDGFVRGYQKIEDRFVKTFLSDGEDAAKDTQEDSAGEDNA